MSPHQAGKPNVRRRPNSSQKAVEKHPESLPFTALTISTDETKEKETEKSKLLALRQKVNPENTENTQGERERSQPAWPVSPRIRSGEPGASHKDPDNTPANHSLQDYQMQLMLNEQQNKRRLMTARQEQDPIARQGQNNTASNTGTTDHKSTMGNPIDGSQNAGYDLSAFENRILRQQVELLQAKLEKYESTVDKPARFQFLYRIDDQRPKNDNSDKTELDSNNRENSMTIFTDCPEIVYKRDNTAHLRCSMPLRNFDLFLALNPEISFVVFRNYNREHQSLGSESEEPLELPAPVSEYIFPVANDMKSALKAILNVNPEFGDIMRNYKMSGQLFAPYFFAYHSRQHFDRIKDQLSAGERNHVNLLIQYLDEEFGQEYENVDYLLERKHISPHYLHYLFKPGEILVEKSNDEYTGYLSKSWISDRTEHPMLNHVSHIFGELMGSDIHERPAKRGSESIDVWNFGFDGGFFQNNKTLYLQLGEEEFQMRSNAPPKSQSLEDLMKTAKPITDLNVFPLEYASQDLIDMLRRRGETFWKCRTRRLVSYSAEENDKSTENLDERYMIDMETYRKLHTTVDIQDPTSGMKLSTEEMAQENPPSERFYYLLPPKTKGYNLRRKKWYEISVDRISDVEWNEEAFHSLVIERSAKDMIQALVTNQIETEKSTDLIAGKGSGLILLLHGGPGTGKTLTAESVAEIAQKPLYRVTCGDVGTKAEEVEKYLESVLYLGRIWGCVVLLDEADIFLEQRSLEDLARNALVSVFLRVLEYYDGILILTSNRVGTFDEAFRSRIQLALHYPNLGPPQRFRIWQMFVDRLDSMGEDVDTADLRDHLDILKDEKLNGRQIRNIITTARQYARWKKTTLTYQHIKEVIRVSGRFDDYLDKLHGGFSADQIAQDDGVR